ncbi:hypothetical protein IAD21_03421 [Abditibacteriota bacterium]|nr:hypothetical protein IAD21_03421 [Abditibacteriota bacterium]
MKRAFTLVEVLIVIAVVLVLAAFLWPMFERAKGSPRRSACQSNLKQVGLGFLQYVRDYDEKFPPARITSASGWADVLLPYTKSLQLFQCPSVARTAPRFASDYFYNRRLARVSLGYLQHSAWTFMMGDGIDNAPPWNSWLQLPADARTNRNSPSWRHLEGANYGFVDGHVKWFKPQAFPRQVRWSPQ